MIDLSPIEFTGLGEAAGCARDRLEQSRPQRIGAAIVAFMLAATGAFAASRPTNESQPAIAAARSAELAKTKNQQSTKLPARQAQAAAVTETAMPLVEPAPPQEALNILQTLLSISNEVVPTGLDPLVEAAISAAKPTAEGYKAFLGSVDQTYFDYAQNYREFNPRQNGIEQKASQFFTWHFTGLYSNANDASSVPVGETNISRLVELMARRDGDKCCAVNWLIGRDGRIFQVAPANAKLRHNPPFDATTTGVEIEATGHSSINSVQIESAIYLTTAVLRYQGLLGNRPLAEVAKGHAETRSRWNAEHPNDKYDGKPDFDASVSAKLRQKMGEFLQAYPEALIKPSNLR